MGRPVQTVSLPVSGYEVDFVTYYTESEDAEIGRHGMEGAKVVVEMNEETLKEDMTITNIPSDRNRRELRRMLDLGVLAARKDGQDVEVGPEFVGNLPRKDTVHLTELALRARAGEDFSDSPKEPTDAQAGS